MKNSSISTHLRPLPKHLEKMRSGITIRVGFHDATKTSMSQASQFSIFDALICLRAYDVMCHVKSCKCNVTEQKLGFQVKQPLARVSCLFSRCFCFNVWITMMSISASVVAFGYICFIIWFALIHPVTVLLTSYGRTPNGSNNG